MKKSVIALFGILCSLVQWASAQTVYVDAVKGTTAGSGSASDPLSSLERAVSLAASFSGQEPVTIKVASGIYTLHYQAELRTANSGNDTVAYTIEAMVMPDDPDWTPVKMPVIQSVSPDNNITQFTHAVGLLVAKNHVSLRGLKFLGNSNPLVRYYYPVSRDNDQLNGLDISQCYFIGERNSVVIQGAVFAQGAGIHVEHCIFFGCKNALLLFRGIKDLSVTHSIIYGAYEAAVWFGPFDAPFNFSNNVISHCAYVWLRADNTDPKYIFSNSVISENEQYFGFFGQQPKPAPVKSQTENNINKTGKVILSEVKTEGLPKDYLNLTNQSAGRELDAGIFKKVK